MQSTEYRILYDFYDKLARMKTASLNFVKDHLEDKPYILLHQYNMFEKDSELIDCFEDFHIDVIDDFLIEHGYHTGLIYHKVHLASGTVTVRAIVIGSDAWLEGRFRFFPKLFKIIRHNLFK